MARPYYHSRTESNAAAYDAQVKREAFWGPIWEALANVGAFCAFVVYCLMWAVMVGFSLGLVYMLIGGLLNIFGVFVPGISVR